jgi:hypothetical protein
MKGIRWFAVCAPIGWSLLALVGWVAILVVYSISYNLIEQNAIPFTPTLRYFEVYRWRDGYFHAKGSYQNQSYREGGDEFPLGSQEINCDKSAGKCNIASAYLYNKYLDIDILSLDIKSWTDKQIIFVDDSAVCATNTYVVDRAAESFALIVRKKALIPEYARKSPLKPCNNIKYKKLILGDGLEVYRRKKIAFEEIYSLYFRVVLVIINIGYFVSLIWLCKRRDRNLNDVIK